MPRRDVESLIVDLDALLEIEEYEDYEKARAKLTARGEEVLKAHGKTRDLGENFASKMSSYARKDPSEYDEKGCRERVETILNDHRYYYSLRNSLKELAKPNLVLLSIGAALILGGIAMAGYFGYPILKASASARWPAVKGKVLSSSVSSHTTKGHRSTSRGSASSDRRGSSASSSGSESTKYHLGIEYVYEVDGKKYAGTRLSFQPPS